MHADAAPSDCRFSDQDVWVRQDGSQVLVGLSPRRVLGLDLAWIGLPRLYERLRVRGRALTLETAAGAIDIPSPLDGVVVALNDAATPEALAADPWGTWLFALRADPAGFEGLLDALDYEARLLSRPRAMR
jgi:glycine cleavage system H lipoate-binding protein